MEEMEEMVYHYTMNNVDLDVTLRKLLESESRRYKEKSPSASPKVDKRFPIAEMRACLMELMDGLKKRLQFNDSKSRSDLHGTYYDTCKFMPLSFLRAIFSNRKDSFDASVTTSVSVTYT